MVKNKKNKKEAVLANYDGEMPVFSDKPISQRKESIIDEGNDNVKYNVNKQTLSKKSGRRKRDESTSESNNEIMDTATSIEKIEVNKSEQNEKLSRNQGQEHRHDSVRKVEKQKVSSKKSDFILFMDDDNDNDDNDDDQAHSQAEMDPKDEDCKTAAKESKHSGKKSKKGKRQEKRNEGDIEQVLAELQIQYNMAHENASANVDVEQRGSTEVVADEEFTKIKKAKKKQKRDASIEVEEDNGIICTTMTDGDDVGTLKTATQKKKEKKERQKRELALAKQRAKELGEKNMKMVEDDQRPERLEETPAEMDDDDEQGKLKTAKKDKKKNKKDKKVEVDEVKKETKKKGVSAALVAAMQERLKKIKEEEERQRQMEEELIRQEEERERLRQEALRPELEKKEKKKQREADRKARLKAEGKLLTKKQKEDRARAQAMLEALKAQGLELPEANEKRPMRLGTRIRPKKLGASKTKDTEEESKESSKSESLDAENDAMAPQDVEEPEVIRDSWDASESDDNGKDDTSQTTSTNNDEKVYGGALASTTTKGDDSDSENSVEEGDDHFESESMQEGIEKDEMGNVNDADSRRYRAEQRILKRQSEAEKKRTIDDLRAAVVCVLGHVDTGKTKILDKLRRTHVQDSEAGGITQQIGATNVPITAIKDQTSNVRESCTFEFRLPGLLIIDTPGHESFSNLRSRGSSLCDIAILVVDIMHGLEQQTIESINLLKKRKCPFIVALNKIDRLYNWKVMAQRDIRDIISEQEENTQLEFKQRAKDVTLQFAEHGLNAALFYENPDPRSYVSLVPTSAITGDGMGNLLFLIVDVCQRMLAKRLMYSDELLATVLEVKVIHGFGTTIDVILMNGRLREGQTMILAGTDGPIVTQIRSLLMPQPLKELRVKNVYVEYKEVKAAQGVKIAAKDLEKAIAGTNLLIAQKHDEVEICKEEVARELKNALSHIKLAPIGVYVQASTLGSLEALLEFLRTSKIPYASIRIGPVVRRDVMKASTMLEHETQYATILAFDVKIEREAQEMADSLGVKIFQADIIYHLFDKFTAYCDELKQRKREEFRSIAVFPCKLKILPLFIFNTRDPIVMGVTVESGILKVGTPICVPSKEFVDIGTVASIELNHKQIDNARKGQEVCIKIDPLSGESPRMYGRHFDADDILVSRITRQSIDACKDYFRDDLVKADWSLMVELKKIFDIL